MREFEMWIIKENSKNKLKISKICLPLLVNKMTEKFKNNPENSAKWAYRGKNSW
ncbi:hypothetical protein LI276_03605 [[Clostridium] scindens]|nr:hypothetical protein [[Clostridium] scindens]